MRSASSFYCDPFSERYLGKIRDLLLVTDTQHLSTHPIMSISSPSKPRLGPTWSKGGKSFKTPSAASTVGEGEIVASATESLENTNGRRGSNKEVGHSGIAHDGDAGHTDTGSPPYMNTISGTTSRGISGVGYGSSVMSEGGIGGLHQGRWVNG